MRIRVLAAALLLTASFAQADEVTTLSDTSRVVAIGGAVTEIVFALGEENKLVGRDSTSVYPEGAFKLPDVGYMRQLSAEGVLSINPTGIIALQGSGPKEAVDVLKKASVQFVEIPETYDHAGILKRIEIVGKALGEEAKAAELIKTTDEKLKAAEAATANIKERKRVLFVLSLKGGKVLASGDGTAASGIIDLAGAVNAVGGFPGYKQLSDEAIITARPDVVLMMDRSGNHGAPPAEDPFANPALAATPAAEGKKLIRMDGAYLLGFGPRTADAIKDFAVALYGDQTSQ